MPGDLTVLMGRKAQAAGSPAPRVSSASSHSSRSPLRRSSASSHSGRSKPPSPTLPRLGLAPHSPTTKRNHALAAARAAFHEAAKERARVAGGGRRFAGAAAYQAERARMGQRLRKIRHATVPSDSICQLLMGLTKQSLLERHYAAGILQAAWRGRRTRVVLAKLAARGEAPRHHRGMVVRLRRAMENQGHLVEDGGRWCSAARLEDTLRALTSAEGIASALQPSAAASGSTCVGWQRAIYSSGFVRHETAGFTVTELTEAIAACSGRSQSSIDPHVTKLQLQPKLLAMVLLYLRPPTHWAVVRAEMPSTWLRPAGVPHHMLTSDKEETPLSRCFELLRKSKERRTARENKGWTAAAPARLEPIRKPSSPALRSTAPRFVNALKAASASG